MSQPVTIGNATLKAGEERMTISERVAPLVEANQGKTSGELAAMCGLTRRQALGALQAMQKRGAVRCEGRGWFPVVKA